MKKKNVSFIALFLVCCLFVSGMPLQVIAAANLVESSALSTAKQKQEKLATVSSSKVLNYVDEEQFESKRFVERIAEQEDLNSYVFKNEEGFYTAYFFSENVKYVDTAGKIVEKDLTITPLRNGYSTAKSDIDVFFPSDPSIGVSIGYKDYSVTMKPQFDTRGVSAHKEEKAISYKGLYGNETNLRYTPTLSGIKEDIILEKYTGKTEYKFTLITNGLSLVEVNGRYHLSNGKGGRAIFNLGEVVSYDAEGRISLGQMIVKVIKEAQQYEITISVDEEFLTASDTVYPVTIDPIITVSDSLSGAGAIQDASIFSARPNSTHGSYEYNRLGTPSSDYGVGRTVVRLSGLTSSSAYTSITASQITRVTFYAKEGTGTTSRYINLYPLNNTSWTESGVTWNNVGTYNTSVNFGANMASAQLTAFDITNLVKGWKNGTYSAQAGFIMMSNSESYNKAFVASEHSDTTRRPYVEMVYEPKVEMDFPESVDITLGTSYSISIVDGGEIKVYAFNPSTTGFYSLQSSNNNGSDPRAWLYNPNYQLLTGDDDGAGNASNFRLVYFLVSGRTYYFVVGCYGNETGSYTMSLSSTTNSNHLTATTIEYDDTPQVNNVSQAVKIFKFVPPETKEYVFYSQGTSDSKAWLYNSSLTMMTNNDDTAGDENFRVAATLTAGQTYYLVAAHFGTSSGTYTVNVLREAELEGQRYEVYNFMSMLYLGIDSSDGEWIVQKDLQENDERRWIFERQNDGYYTIRSTLGVYYIGISSVSIGSDNIKLYTSIQDSTKWKVYRTALDEIVIEPKNAPGKLLSAVSDEVEDRLQLRFMGVSNIYGREWELTYIGYRLSVNHYYDEAFYVMRPEAEQRITWYQERCAELLQILFDVNVEYTIQDYVSYGDICPQDHDSRPDIMDPCACENADHRSYQGLLSSFSEDKGTSDGITVSVLWTGYAGGSRCWANVNSGTILMCEMQDMNGDQPIAELLHEISHQIGARDHYCYIDNHNDSSTEYPCSNGNCYKCVYSQEAPPQCVMATVKDWGLGSELSPEEISSIFCAACKKDGTWNISIHLENHH